MLEGTPPWPLIGMEWSNGGFSPPKVVLVVDGRLDWRSGEEEDEGGGYNLGEERGWIGGGLENFTFPLFTFIFEFTLTDDGIGE